MQTGAAALGNSMEVPQKLKIELPYDPAIAQLGIYPKDTGVLTHRGTCAPMLTEAFSTKAKLCKEPKCPSTHEWIKKLWFRRWRKSMEVFCVSHVHEIKLDQH